MQTVTFSGLHCDACVRLISKKLENIAGIDKIEPIKPQGAFSISGSHIFTLDEIKNATKDLNYPLVSVQ